MPLMAVLADEKNAARGAAVFHATLVAALADWVLSTAGKEKVLVGAGGCFLNQVLSRGLHGRLGSHGLQLIEA